MIKSKEGVISLLKASAIILVNIIVICTLFTVQKGSVSVLSQYGSRGSEVTQIQTKLKRWGYYNGNIDGIFGNQTTQAVKDFQKKNGLAVDGIAGPKTLEAMGIMSGADSGGSSSGGNKTNNQNIELLARIISAEARGESYTGQVAVGAVVLNRVEHPSFPDSIAGVVYQPGAFTAITDGQIREPVTDSARKAAQDALNGWDPSGGAIYYFNPDKTSNKWIRARPVILRIGKHLFCS